MIQRLNEGMKEILLVASGGSIGALLRYLLYKFLQVPALGSFPIATLIINCTGSFLLGFFLNQIRGHSDLGLFLALGVLGSFTTFSTFSLESVQLIRDGHTLLFALNIVASFAFGLLSLASGMWLRQLVF